MARRTRLLDWAGGGGARGRWRDGLLDADAAPALPVLMETLARYIESPVGLCYLNGSTKLTLSVVIDALGGMGPGALQGEEASDLPGSPSAASWVEAGGCGV